MSSRRRPHRPRAPTVPAEAESLVPKEKPSRRPASGVSIRPLELGDLEPVYTLGERLFRADSYPSLYRTWDEFELVAFFESDYDTCFVAEDEAGEVVGFVLGTVLEKRRSAWRYGWIVWLGVDRTRARRGVASRLLEKLTETFVELGCRILLADTDPDNRPAVRFFEKNGFGNPRPHVYLEKNLSKDPRRLRGKEPHRPRARRSGEPEGA